MLDAPEEFAEDGGDWVVEVAVKEAHRVFLGHLFRCW
jgi:hypothetical protein